MSYDNLNSVFLEWFEILSAAYRRREEDPFHFFVFLDVLFRTFDIILQ
jgi:hypothetical protein